MKYVPILFSTPMVQAILDGTKTQTRRVVKYNKKIENPEIGSTVFTPERHFSVRGLHENGEYGESFFKSKACKGDVFWVRETWQYTGPELNIKPGYVYKATDPDWKNIEGFTWKPSIFMPKEACRLFLKVTNVRVERLQDISTEDIKQEGVKILVSKDGDMLLKLNKKHPEISFLNDWGFTVDNKPNEMNLWLAHWASLWSTVNGRESWDANPWVWVYDFKRIQKPVDFV